MDVIDAISHRRSVREYTEQRIPSELMDELLRMSTLAASGNNMQPWGFVVIQDREEIEFLNRAVKSSLLTHLDDIPHLQPYRPKLEDPDFSVLNHTSNLVIIYGDTAAHYYTCDCSLAAANLMLAGRSKGIESCWIGFAEYYFDTPIFKEAYHIPERYALVSVLTMGYPLHPPAEAPARKPPLVFHRT